MDDRAILMSAPMVCACLDGTKTQTRRAVKGWALEWLAPGMFTPEFVADPGSKACPYGQPGDRLWVRETYFAWGRWETRFSAKKGRDEWHFIDMTLEAGKSYLYAASGQQPQPMGGKPHRGGITPKWWKRPAIFMPRAASRITLEVTGVRVERLQEISDADCIAEGCTQNHNGYFRGGPHAVSGLKQMATAKQAYRDLWGSINGPESWAANPYVWVVSFRRMSDAS